MEWNTIKIVLCPGLPYILSGMVGLKHVKDLLLSGCLDCFPGPKVRATVRAEFEIIVMLMEVRITATGFIAPKIDPDLFSII